jgi:hypothetical protein
MKKIEFEISDYEYRYLLDLLEKGDRLSEGDLSWAGDLLLSNID